MKKSREKNKKKGISILIPVLSVLLGLVIGACVGLVGASLAKDGGSDTANPLSISYTISLIAILYLSFFLHIVIHESGHLFFGLKTGYKFLSFRIANIMWVKKDDNIQIKRLSLLGTGGQCLLEPPDLKNGTIPFVLYNIGGTLFNVIFSLVFFAIGMIFFVPGMLQTFFIIFAVIGIVLGLLNIIPFPSVHVQNDGSNLVQMKKSKTAQYSMWLQLKLAAEMTKGNRLKNLPQDWFQIPPKEELHNAVVTTIAVFAENRYMDMQNFSDAKTVAENLCADDIAVLGLYKQLLCCDRLFIALIEGEPQTVIDSFYDKNLQKFLRQMKNFPSVIRTQYAYAVLCEKNAEKAEAIKKQFEKTAKTYPYSGDIESERELIEKANACL